MVSITQFGVEFGLLEAIGIGLSVLFGVLNVIQGVRNRDLKRRLREDKEPLLQKIVSIRKDMNIKKTRYTDLLAELDGEKPHPQNGSFNEDYRMFLEMILNDLEDFKVHVAGGHLLFTVYRDLGVHEEYYTARLKEAYQARTESDAGSVPHPSQNFRRAYEFVLERALADMDDFRTHLEGDIQTIDAKVCASCGRPVRRRSEGCKKDYHGFLFGFRRALGFRSSSRGNT